MNRPRQGLSLVELLVAMTASIVVLTLSSSLLVRAMHVQMQARAFSSAEQSAVRFAAQFRRDVHQAVSAVAFRAAPTGDAFLILQFPDDRQVEYARSDGTIVRIVLADGESKAREEFEIPAACKLSVRESDEPPRLAITITTNADFAAAADGRLITAAAAAPVFAHVEAVLGRDRRFAVDAESKEPSP